MSGEVSRRRWYLVVRREGVVTQRIEVKINPMTGDVTLDPFVGPEYRDFDTFPVGTEAIDVEPADVSILAEFELVGCTQIWEVSHVE